jgi:hypothetical protein
MRPCTATHTNHNVIVGGLIPNTLNLLLDGGYKVRFHSHS